MAELGSNRGSAYPRPRELLQPRGPGPGAPGTINVVTYAKDASGNLVPVSTHAAPAPPQAPPPSSAAAVAAATAARRQRSPASARGATLPPRSPPAPAPVLFPSAPPQPGPPAPPGGTLAAAAARGALSPATATAGGEGSTAWSGVGVVEADLLGPAPQAPADGSGGEPATPRLYSLAGATRPPAVPHGPTPRGRSGGGAAPAGGLAPGVGAASGAQVSAPGAPGAGQGQGQHQGQGQGQAHPQQRMQTGPDGLEREDEGVGASFSFGYTPVGPAPRQVTAPAAPAPDPRTLNPPPPPLPRPDVEGAAAAEDLGGRLPDAHTALAAARRGARGPGAGRGAAGRGSAGQAGGSPEAAAAAAEAEAVAAAAAALLPHAYYQGGTAKARREVFERRGRLTRELTGLGLPPVYEHRLGVLVGKQVATSDDPAGAGAAPAGGGGGGAAGGAAWRKVRQRALNPSGNPIMARNIRAKAQLAQQAARGAARRAEAVPSARLLRYTAVLDEASRTIAKLRVVTGAEELRMGSAPISKPYHPRCYPFVPPANETEGGDLMPGMLMRKMAEQIAAERAAAEEEAAAAARIPEAEAERQRRIRELAEVIVAAPQLGIHTLGVYTQRELQRRAAAAAAAAEATAAAAAAAGEGPLPAVSPELLEAIQQLEESVAAGRKAVAAAATVDHNEGVGAGAREADTREGSGLGGVWSDDGTEGGGGHYLLEEGMGMSVEMPGGMGPGGRGGGGSEEPGSEGGSGGGGVRAAAAGEEPAGAHYPDQLTFEANPRTGLEVLRYPAAGGTLRSRAAARSPDRGAGAARAKMEQIRAAQAAAALPFDLSAMRRPDAALANEVTGGRRRAVQAAPAPGADPAAAARPLPPPSGPVPGPAAAASAASAPPPGAGPPDDGSDPGSPTAHPAAAPAPSPSPLRTSGAAPPAAAHTSRPSPALLRVPNESVHPGKTHQLRGEPESAGMDTSGRWVRSSGGGGGSPARRSRADARRGSRAGPVGASWSRESHAERGAAMLAAALGEVLDGAGGGGDAEESGAGGDGHDEPASGGKETGGAEGAGGSAAGRGVSQSGASAYGRALEQEGAEGEDGEHAEFARFNVHSDDGEGEEEDGEEGEEGEGYPAGPAGYPAGPEGYPAGPEEQVRGGRGVQDHQARPARSRGLGPNGVWVDSSSDEDDPWGLRESQPACQAAARPPAAAPHAAAGDAEAGAGGGGRDDVSSTGSWGIERRDPAGSDQAARPHDPLHALLRLGRGGQQEQQSLLELFEVDDGRPVDPRDIPELPFGALPRWLVGPAEWYQETEAEREARWQALQLREAGRPGSRDTDGARDAAQAEGGGGPSGQGGGAAAVMGKVEEALARAAQRPPGRAVMHDRATFHFTPPPRF